MVLQWDCTIPLFLGRLCNVAHLEEGTEFVEDRLRAEFILRVVGGQYDGWYFAKDAEWVRQNTRQAV